MQVIYCPGGEVSLLSSGEEIQTNMRTGISCLAFWGVTSMTFFLLGSEECFNYSKLSKWWQYLRSSAGRLGNFVAVQVCLRARSFTVYLAMPPSGEVAGRYGARCACGCCSCGEHSDVGPGRAGTWFSREKEHSMRMASQPISNAFIKVPPRPPPRGALHKDDGENRTAAPWQNSDPYTLFGVGLGTVTSHETWIQNGPQTSYGEPTDAKNFLNCSIKHCFICVPMTQKSGMGPAVPEMKIQTLTENPWDTQGDHWRQQRNCWSTETLIVSWKHTDLVRKCNLGTNVTQQRSSVIQGTGPDAAWVVWAGGCGDNPAWVGLWRRTSSAGCWKVPGLFYGRGEKKQIQGMSKTEKI